MLFTAVGGQTRSALRLSRAFHGCGLASPFVWYHSIATTFQAAVPPPTISTVTTTTTTITTYACTRCSCAEGAMRLLPHGAWCETIHPQRMVRGDSPTAHGARRFTHTTARSARGAAGRGEDG